MMRLVGGHSLEYRTAPRIGGGQSLQVVHDMRLDLLFRFRDESEARRIAEGGGRSADADAAAVPERREQTRPGPEFLQPLRAPGEMIPLLGRRGVEPLAGRIVAGEERLARIERLRGDFAGVVHAHQGGAAAALGGTKAALDGVTGG